MREGVGRILMNSELLQFFKRVLQKLEETQISYMVVGSVASMIYGEPRLTHDLDLVFDIFPKDVEKLSKIFSSDEGFYCPPNEVLKSEVVHRGQFNIIHFVSGVKVDFMVRKESPFAIEEFSRRKKIAMFKDFELFIASPEDIIIKKLDFYRMGGSEKHLKDIRGMLAETEVDMIYLNKWLSELSLEKEWGKVTPSS